MKEKYPGKDVMCQPNQWSLYVFTVSKHVLLHCEVEV